MVACSLVHVLRSGRICFCVCFPAVGVMDMLRYHKFTAGAGWAYGLWNSRRQQRNVDYIHRYSACTKCKARYMLSATFVTTADHDDRVVPAHSFKFSSTTAGKASL